MGNHRADHRAVVRESSGTTTRAAGGRRKAVKEPRKAKLVSAPVFLGVAALAVSAGGAVTVGVPDIAPVASSASLNSNANALSGVNNVGSVSAAATRRGPEVSRDSSRTALEEANDKTELREEANAISRQRNAELTELAKKVDQHVKELEADTWVLPVSGYRITNTFGLARSYYASGAHTGLDFAVASGTPIHAIANGTITEMGYDGSYGNKTVLTLDDGTEIWFAHQTGFADFSVGDTVVKGDLIGYVGSTGNSTGPHVHIEVRPGGGDPVDPAPAFEQHGVTP